MNQNYSSALIPQTPATAQFRAQNATSELAALNPIQSVDEFWIDFFWRHAKAHNTYHQTRAIFRQMQGCQLVIFPEFPASHTSQHCLIYLEKEEISLFAASEYHQILSISSYVGNFQKFCKLLGYFVSEGVNIHPVCCTQSRRHQLRKERAAANSMGGQA